MNTWPQRPIIYEINTFLWLWELGEEIVSTVALASVPANEWNAIAAFAYDAVLLMGVWVRSLVDCNG